MTEAKAVIIAALITAGATLASAIWVFKESQKAPTPHAFAPSIANSPPAESAWNVPTTHAATIGSKIEQSTIKAHPKPLRPKVEIAPRFSAPVPELPAIGGQRAPELRVGASADKIEDLVQSYAAEAKKSVTGSAADPKIIRIDINAMQRVVRVEVFTRYSDEEVRNWNNTPSNIQNIRTSYCQASYWMPLFKAGGALMHVIYSETASARSFTVISNC